MLRSHRVRRLSNMFGTHQYSAAGACHKPQTDIAVGPRRRNSQAFQVLASVKEVRWKGCDLVLLQISNPP